MQPDSPFNGLEGLKHMPTAIVPSIYDEHLADRNIEMPTERAYAMCKQLARTQGLLVGISAAAAAAACLDVAVLVIGTSAGHCGKKNKVSSAAPLAMTSSK